jgi:ATP-dependent Lon protease
MAHHKEKTLREQILAGEIYKHLDFFTLSQNRRQEWVSAELAKRAASEKAKTERPAEIQPVQAAPEIVPDHPAASDVPCSNPGIPLFAPEAMLVEMEKLKGRSGKDTRTFWERKMEHVGKAGGHRLLAQAPDDWQSQINSLRDKCPNFEAVIEHLQDEFSFAALGERQVPMLTPILLVGPAGVGKSLFAEALSDLLAGGIVRQSMENSQGGFDLAGSASHWSNTAPGKVFNALVDGRYANPLIFCDEVDKINVNEQRYDPHAPLYGLLEGDTAQHWQDQCVAVDIDASHLRWVFTANALAPIPAPILNRLQVFEIAPPTPEQARSIARNIFQSLKAQVIEVAAIQDACFDALELSDAGLSVLQGLAPRSIKLALRRGMARAMTRIKSGDGSRVAVLAADLMVKVSAQPAKIGFI